MGSCTKFLIVIALIGLTAYRSTSVDAAPECKKSNLGMEYHGLISQTVTGRTCQSWTSQLPHKHDIWTRFPEGSQKDAKNYCRNPDNSPETHGPWCYTTDPNVRWEYCSVPYCAECKKTKQGKEYSGALNLTVSGRACQRWASQQPNSHIIFKDFPEGNQEEAKNYCRNPDNSPGGPWCYTTDPDTRREYCNVQFCADCKKTMLGTEYNGARYETVSGKICQNWASQYPHNHIKFTNFPDGSQEEAQNFCRNPDNSPYGPWCYTADPGTRWEYCDVKFCAECKKTVLGTEYDGVKAETLNGLICQEWTSQTPHSHQVWNKFPESSKLAAKNYCRNPDNSPDGPWCYTVDDTVRWEYCDVQLCADCKATTKGVEYNGDLSVTKSGHTCQNWASQVPQSHRKWTNFPEGSEELANNYCRNPDNSPDGPWCYTTNPNVRWDYCEVDFC